MSTHFGDGGGAVDVVWGLTGGGSVCRIVNIEHREGERMFGVALSIPVDVK